jgi:hypothetical protein
MLRHLTTTSKQIDMIDTVPGRGCTAHLLRVHFKPWAFFLAGAKGLYFRHSVATSIDTPKLSAGRILDGQWMCKAFEALIIRSAVFYSTPIFWKNQPCMSMER